MSDEGNQIDLSQSQQVEITFNHTLSNDELMQTIKRANGMPVLFIPSSDGRLAAVTVDGLQKLMPTDRNAMEDSQRRQKDFRSWLVFLATLVATISFTAGLAPPGGFWTGDDEAKGYCPGTAIMHDMFPRRYKAFFYCNATAFFSSFLIIAMLAKDIQTNSIATYNQIFRLLVVLCFLSVVGSYTSGIFIGIRFSQAIYIVVLVIAVIGYLFMQLRKFL